MTDQRVKLGGGKDIPNCIHPFEGITTVWSVPSHPINSQRRKGCVQHENFLMVEGGSVYRSPKFFRSASISSDGWPRLLPTRACRHPAAHRRGRSSASLGRRGRNGARWGIQRRIEHDGAVRLAFIVYALVQIENALAGADEAFDDPVDGAAVQDLVLLLRHHARPVEQLRLLAASCASSPASLPAIRAGSSTLSLPTESLIICRVTVPASPQADFFFAASACATFEAGARPSWRR